MNTSNRHPEEAAKRPSRRATARLWRRGRSSFEARSARTSSDKRRSRLRGDDGSKSATGNQAFYVHNIVHIGTRPHREQFDGAGVSACGGLRKKQISATS